MTHNQLIQFEVLLDRAWFNACHADYADALRDLRSAQLRVKAAARFEAIRHRDRPPVARATQAAA
jgi:hypothetical protein